MGTGESQFYGAGQPGQYPGQYAGQSQQYAGQYSGMQARPQPFYSGDNSFQLRPEDQAALDQLGPQGIKTGTNALKIATQLVKGVFPTTGPVVRNGEIQTKWGSYALPNPQDADVIDKLLQATRDLIQKMTINV